MVRIVNYTKSHMYTILSIETSCDETSVSLIQATQKSDTEIDIQKISHLVHSQADLHAEYGGVFPSLAKREHAHNIVPLMQELIIESQHKHSGVFVSQSNTEVPNEVRQNIAHILEREPELYDNIVRHLCGYKGNIDAIAVTQGPGLEPALWIGINFARSLGVLWDVPVVPINHMEGHVISALFNEHTSTLSPPPFPTLALLISGGHTEIIKMTDPNSYTLIGKTRDDAIGEAYDKVARLLGLPYPGGPEIARLAEHGRTKNITSTEPLPRPMIHSDDIDFSFSGLKTAVLYRVKDTTLTEEDKIALAREFEDAVTDVLSHKLQKAFTEHPAQMCLVGGGVAANTYIRERIVDTLTNIDSSIDVKFPNKELATDNAFMIALALAFRHFFSTLQEESPSDNTFRASGNLSISSSL